MTRRTKIYFTVNPQVLLSNKQARMVDEMIHTIGDQQEL